MSISNFNLGDVLVQSSRSIKIIASKVIGYLLVKKFYLYLLIVVFLLLPTGLPGDGNVVKLNDRLNLLQVQNGYSNRVSDYFGARGFSLASNNDNTVWSSTMNGYGNAVEIVTGKAPEGILLSVKEGELGYVNGFRDHDVVKKVVVDPNCAKDESSLRLNWRNIYKCDSKVTISRDSGEVTLSIPRGGDAGVNGIIIRSDKFFNIPKAMRSSWGTSGGLAFSLYHLDTLGEGSLFSNDIVAATGSIYPSNGSIGAIEGLRAKAAAAQKAGASLLFIPKGQRDEIGSYKNLSIFEVSNLREAALILCSRGARDEVCSLLEKRR